MPSENEHVVEGRYSVPRGGERYRLTQSMYSRLAGHPLSADLMLVSAGVDQRSEFRRPYKLEKLPGVLVGYCTGGLGELQTGGKQYDVHSGDLVVLPDGADTFLVPAKNSWWNFYFIVCRGSAADLYFKQLMMDEPVVRIGSNPRLVDDMVSFVNMRHAPMRFDLFLECSSRLKYFFSSLAVLINDGTNGDVGGKFDHCMRLMQANLASDLQLKDLADACDLSVSHFVRQFKQLNGQSPMHYFTHLKMQHACGLLESTDSSIKIISSQVGFDDPYNFSKTFKRVIGLSPANYRKQKLIV